MTRREDITKIEDALKLVKEEIERAFKKHHGFNSAHEGWAVIKEELEEFKDDLDALKDEIGLNDEFDGLKDKLDKTLERLWQGVKLKKENAERMEKCKNEAIHLAAMSTRFIIDFFPRKSKSNDEVQGMAPEKPGNDHVPIPPLVMNQETCGTCKNWKRIKVNDLFAKCSKMDLETGIYQRCTPRNNHYENKWDGLVD
jgi:hypothetical protein